MQRNDDQQTPNGSPTNSFLRTPNKLQASQSLKNKKGRTSPPSSSAKIINRSVSEIPSSKLRQVNKLNKTEFAHIEEASVEDSDSDASPRRQINEKLNEARLRLRRSKPIP